MLRQSDRVKPLLSRSPDQGWQIDADRIEPRLFAREVPVMALLNMAGPSGVEVGGYPTTFTGRPIEVESGPCMAVGRVLQHAAPSAHGGKRGSKAAIVIPELVLMRLAGTAVPEAAPALAGRVRHDRMRAGVGAGVARFVP